MLSRKLITGILQIRCNYTYARINGITDKRLGESLTVKGWVRANRRMKKFTFVDVNDGSTQNNLQIVLNKSVQDKVESLNYGTSISVSGKLSQTPKGQLELQADDIELVGSCPSSCDGYPFDNRQTYAPEYVRDHMHLRTRIDSMCSTLRIRHQATKAFHRHLDEQGFCQTQTPVLTSNDCEGAGEIFVVKPDSKDLLHEMKKESVSLDEAYFDRKAYLTVSGQLHLEAMVNHLGAVYSFGPIFRSENSLSPNHLAEFTMLEAEEAFIDTTEQLAARVDNMVRSVTKSLLNTCETEIQCISSSSTVVTDNRFDWVDREFPRLTYAEAGRILTSHQAELNNPFDAARGLNREQELFLVKHVQGPLFVIDWPRELKPFYMRQKAENPELVEALDFLVPGVGELVGGSLREDNYERLEVNLPSDNLQWYLDLRRYGCARSAGFGLGFERYLQLITGIFNIREVIPFPRWPHHCAL